MVTQELMLSQYTAAKERFPKLNQPEPSISGWLITGSIDVIDDEGGYWDTYDVSIAIPADFPDSLPRLYETGGKIEKSEDWHNSGVCCLSTEAIIFAQLYGNRSLLNWLEKFAHPFLANHIVKKETSNYANGEFDHGTPGIIQGYFKLFNTTKVEVVLKKLRRYVNAAEGSNRNLRCFCGSKKKTKNCFLEDPEKHTEGIPLRVLKSDFTEILNHLCKHKEK